MQADKDIHETIQPLPGPSNQRTDRRQTTPWALLRELTAAVQDFNVKNPEDDMSSPAARPFEPR